MVVQGCGRRVDKIVWVMGEKSSAWLNTIGDLYQDGEVWSSQSFPFICGDPNERPWKPICLMCLENEGYIW